MSEFRDDLVVISANILFFPNKDANVFIILSVFGSVIFDGTMPRSGAAYLFRIFLESPQNSRSRRFAAGLFVPQSGQGIGVV